MPAPPRTASRDRGPCLWGSLPCSACVRAVCCSHLRFMWLALMLLSVVCVALQILGVVRQARNTKVVELAGEKLVRFSVAFHRTFPSERRRDWERLRSIPATVIEDPKEGGPLRWGGAKGARLVADPGDEGRRGQERDGQEAKQAPPRRLASTVNRITDTRKVDRGNSVPSIGGVALPKGTMVKRWPHPGVIWTVVEQNYLEGGVANLKPHPVARSHVSPHATQALPHGNHDSKDKPAGGDWRAATRHTAATLINNKQQYRYNEQDRSIVVTPPPPCQPRNHVVFLKTHKTASSTILNILYRYGDRRDLTFALPLGMHSQLFYPTFFSAHFVEGVRGSGVREFHVMCNHMRFRAQEVRKVMPKDTFYFSILRNPVAMMESIFIYYKGIPAFRGVKSLEDFLVQGGRSFNASMFNNHYAQNLLTFDFGFDNSGPVNETQLDARSAELVAAVEHHFHLILISEYFDESMVLLRHALCWTLEDVVSFRLNSRSERARRPLTPETADRVKAWNALDWRLYRHFNATFWRRVDATLGRNQLALEVELLRARRAELQQTCLSEGGAVDPGQVRDSSLKPFQYGVAVIQGYNLRPELDNATRCLCQSLITPELQYTTALYAKQFPELFAKRTAAAKQKAAAKNTANINNAANIHNAAKREAGTQINANADAKHSMAKRTADSHNAAVHDTAPENATAAKRSAQIHTDAKGATDTHTARDTHRDTHTASKRAPDTHTALKHAPDTHTASKHAPDTHTASKHAPDPHTASKHAPDTHTDVKSLKL